MPIENVRETWLQTVSRIGDKYLGHLARPWCFFLRYLVGVPRTFACYLY